MTAKTFAQARSRISDWLLVAEEHQQEMSASPGFLSRAQDFLDGIAGYDYAAGARSAVLSQRAAVQTPCSRDALNSVLDSLVREVAGSSDIDSPAANGNSQPAMWREIYDYMATNNVHVKSRGLTYGSVSAGGGNTGDLSVIRLTEDENGYPMEGWLADAFTLTCEQDANTSGVQEFEERFVLRGTTAAPPTVGELNRDGTGLVASLTARSLADSKRYLTNPGFDEFGGSAAVGSPAAPASLNGWTTASGDFSNCQIDLDTTYRDEPKAGTSASLRLTDNETISQDLLARGRGLLINRPVFIRVRVYRRDSCDGNVVITLGGLSRTVALSGLSNSSWNEVDIVATPGENNWYQAIKTSGLTFSIELENRTTGSIHLDTIQFHAMEKIGGDNTLGSVDGRGSQGTYILLVPNQTGSLEGDSYTFTDTETSPRTAVNNYHFAVAGRGYLPSVADATEVTAAGGRTLTFAASGKTITASSGSFISDGFVVGQTLTSAGTSSNNGTFTITNVTALVITVSETVVNEGPLSSTATLNATAAWADGSD